MLLCLGPPERQAVVKLSNQGPVNRGTWGQRYNSLEWTRGGMLWEGKPQGYPYDVGIHNVTHKFLDVGIDVRLAELPSTLGHI